MSDAPDARDDTRSRRRLILTRALRSTGQGVLVVDFPLYLDALGWSGVEIGALFTGIIITQAALTLFVGPLSDRYGRRTFLLAYDTLLVGCAALALATPAGWALILAALGGGFGRGMNGGAGPFSPVEQAWLARVTPAHRRGAIFSLNAAVGAFGMAAGALAAALPAIWQAALPGATAYRPMFLLVAGAAIATLGVLLSLHEPSHQPPAPSAPPRGEETRRIAKIAAVTAINGAAIGLVTPLLTYWFLVRFGVGPARIGPVLAASFLCAGLTSLATGRLVRNGHLVRTVVLIRATAVGLLVALPLAPTFAIAAGLLVARSALNRGTAGARQALELSLVSDARRGLSATASSLARQSARAFGPLAAGALFGGGFLGVPFYIAAGLQAAYLVIYQRVFARYEKLTPELRAVRDHAPR